MKNLVLILIVVLGLVFCWAGESWAGEKITVKVTNPIKESRNSETISLDLKALGAFEKTKPAVYSDKLKMIIPCQVIDDDNDGTGEELIFQSDFGAKETQLFEITEANIANQIEPKYCAVANYVPQRKDDFAWENDKIAFRMYGQELQRTELTSSGIDIWVKKVGKPVMIDLYAKGHDYFHSDNPMGIDFFDIGPTLGCGGLGVWFDGKLYRSENYNEWKIIANGPIRAIFELTYKPWQFGDRKVGETKRISLDLGSNFNRIESRFDADVNDVTLAVGIVKCEKRGGHEIFAKDKRWLSYWQNIHPKFGTIGCGVILPKDAARNESVDESKNYLLLAKPNGFRSITYYAGAGWSKSAQFDSEAKWTAFVEKTARLIENPVKIKVVKK
ncbi:MAG: DUF4861 domain-containing protein [Sedimentisphaerales bacterium]